MTDTELSKLDAQFSRLDQRLSDIKETQGRQEKALIDIFRANREDGARLAGLDTVVRMSLAEQKRINNSLRTDILELRTGEKDLKKSWDEKDKQIDIRMRGTERRLAYFAGGLAVLLLVFNLAVRFGPGLLIN